MQKKSSIFNVPVLSLADRTGTRRLAKILARGSQNAPGIEKKVVAILKDVKKRGDRAVLAHTEKYDGVRIAASDLLVSKSEMEAAFKSLPKSAKQALQVAADRIKRFHTKQRQSSWTFKDSLGTKLGQRVSPLRRVGVYVPGGTAAYPSSVLMNVIPAKVAGVPEIVMVSPPTTSGSPMTLLAAAHLAGVTTFFRIGGAQAVAALAYGTKTIPPVDKIVGPGNIYVATAKRLVFGQVDIDMVAGPSEILVIADDSARPAYVAADMLSQAEHDELAAALCIATSRRIGEAVAREIKNQIANLPRRAIASKSLRRFGAIFFSEAHSEILTVANKIAAEHVELAVARPSAWADKIHNAGAIFMGHSSTEPFGDYVAGPNHVLPTGGTARFSSPLGVYDFLKRTSLIQASPKSLRKLGPHVIALAKLEGLQAHARAIEYRTDGGKHGNKNG